MSYSSSAQVVFGVIQGSVIEPELYIIFINSLLRLIRLIYLLGMQTTSKLSLISPFTALLRCKQKLTRLCSGQMLNILLAGLISATFYTTGSKQIITKDLGVIRSAAISNAGHYQTHILPALKPLQFQWQSGVYFGQGLKNYSGRHSKYM